jgi:hypothetical protein
LTPAIGVAGEAAVWGRPFEFETTHARHCEPKAKQSRGRDAGGAVDGFVAAHRGNAKRFADRAMAAGVGAALMAAALHSSRRPEALT